MYNYAIPVFTERFFTDFRSQEPQTMVRGNCPFPDGVNAEGDFAELEKNTQYVAFKREYEKLIDTIVQHASELSHHISPCPNITKIRDNFNELKRHLFSSNYFSGHRKFLYVAVKDMFHHFEELLSDEKIPCKLRMNAISLVAYKMLTCSGGVATELNAGISMLSGGALMATTYSEKKIIVDNLISEYVNDHHPNAGENNEVHYGNAYFNRMARSIGLEEIPDPFEVIGSTHIDDESIAECKNYVTARLSPVRVAMTLADEYLSKIRVGLVDQKIDPDKKFANDNIVTLNNCIDVEQGALEYEYGSVNRAFYLRYGNNAEYEIIKDPTLLARNFIEEFKKNGLVEYDHAVSLTEKNKNGEEIKCLGGLVWRDSCGEGEILTPQELSSLSPNDIDSHLRQQGVCDEERQRLLYALSQQLFDCVMNGRLNTYPEKWVADCIDLLKQNKLGHAWIQPVLMLATAFDHGEHVNQIMHIAPTGFLGAGQSHEITPVMLAAQTGCLNALDALLKGGAPIHAIGPGGVTAAMLAAEYGHEKVLSKLIAKGASVNATDSHGVTAAMKAAKRGHTEVLRKLLIHGASVNVTDNSGKNALMIAAESGQVGAIGVLMHYGAEVNKKDNNGVTAVMLAAQGGHAEALRMLRQQGADFHLVDDHGDGAATYAAKYGRLEVIDELQQGGIDLLSEVDNNITLCDLLAFIATERGHAAFLDAMLNISHGVFRIFDNNNATVGVRAAAKGNVEVMRVLIKHDPQVINYCSDNNFSPVAIAAAMGNIAVLELLLETGADPNTTGPEGVTPAMVAANYGKLEALRVLVAHGANIVAKDEKSFFPVQFAAMNNHDEVLKYLVEQGAISGAHARDGEFALLYAAECGSNDAIAVLLAHGVSVNSQITFYNETGTPLLLAAAEGMVDTVKLLINAGANTNDSYSERAAQAAADNGHTDVLKFLIDSGVVINENVVRSAVHGKNPKAAMTVLLPKLINDSGVDIKRDLLMEAISAGIDVNLPNESGRTLLMCATESGDLALVRFLLQCGANLYQETTAHLTALEIAINSGRKNAIKVLLRAAIKSGVEGLAIYKRDVLEALLPMLIKFARKDLDLVEVFKKLLPALVEQKANLDIQDTHGQTLLMLAARSGDLNMVTKLIELGAEPNVQDNKGNSALKYAAMMGRVDVMKVLLKNRAHIDFDANAIRFADTVSEAERNDVRELLSK